MWPALPLSALAEGSAGNGVFLYLKLSRIFVPPRLPEKISALSEQGEKSVKEVKARNPQQLSLCCGQHKLLVVETNITSTLNSVYASLRYALYHCWLRLLNNGGAVRKRVWYGWLFIAVSFGGYAEGIRHINTKPACGVVSHSRLTDTSERPDEHVSEKIPERITKR